jgi:hypothetical protein
LSEVAKMGIVAHEKYQKPGCGFLLTGMAIAARR